MGKKALGNDFSTEFTYNTNIDVTKPFKRQINQDNSVYLISVKASWWSESTHFTPCTGRTATTDREISITQQWRSKDLGTAREIFLSSLVISLDSTPDNKF